MLYTIISLSDIFYSGEGRGAECVSPLSDLRITNETCTNPYKYIEIKKHGGNHDGT